MMAGTEFKQVKTPWPSVSALCSLLWRAVALAPFAIVPGVVWLVTWPLLVLLPVCEIFCLYEEDWVCASIAPVVWVSLFLFSRSRWFKADRRDFPNERENV